MLYPHDKPELRASQIRGKCVIKKIKKKTKKVLTFIFFINKRLFDFT